jgi:hypothetical protein
LATFPEQRNAPRQGVTITALNAGIETRQLALERGIARSLIIECVGSVCVFAHFILGFLFLEP